MSRIEFDGCFNFRDLGGRRTDDGRVVRTGRLFRADSVHLMSEADASRAREELGLRTLLDLRGDIEVTVGGVGLLADAGLVRRHLPLSSRRTAVVDGTAAAAASSDRSPDAMVEQYLAILDASSDLIVRAVEELSRDDSLPAVFFCAAGKDRTGVLSAVILGTLGVRDADIVDDYVRTTDTIVEVIERFAGTPGAPAMYRDLPPTNFAPYAETMERVIADVRREHGSFAEYLIANGLAKESIDALEGALLEVRT